MQDFVIIGAGIVGSFLAHDLSKYDCKVMVIDKENDFLLARDDCYYLFCHGLKMSGDANVALEEKANYTSSFYVKVYVRIFI